MDEPEQPDGATLSDLIEEERVLVFQCSLPCAKLPEDARLAPKQTTELSIPQSWSKRGPMKSALHPSNQPHLGAMPCIASGRLMQRPADKGDTPIRTVNLLSEAELERCFLSLPAAALRTCLVACKAWGLAIRNHPILSLRRLEFEWSGTDYDRQGIVYYLGTMFGSRSMWSNPAKSALLDVKVHSSSRVSGASRKLAGTRHGENVTNVLSHGVSHFQTDGLPFSWVAVDLGDFAISPTHYTLGTSTSLTCFPVTWQLMGAEAAGRSDDLDMWDHWVLLDDVRHADPPFSAARLSATFPAKLPAAHQAYYRYLRVVQVGPNQQFGHNFLISGLEFYGHLRREKDKACAGASFRRAP